jgi:uncharacterized protein YdgA (DUF945 family)
MRKIGVIFITAITAIVFLVLAAPFCMGLWVQKRYAQVIPQLNTAHISFALIQFKRGWFHSHAQLEVTLHSAETTLSGESIALARFVIHQDIQHGPLVVQRSADDVRHWTIARASMENISQDENLNFKADTLWTLANTLNTRLQVQHLLLGNERQRIEVNQLAGNISFTPTDQHFETHLTLVNGSLYENNPDKVGNNIIDLVKVMEVDGFTTTLDIRKIAALWYGDRHFSAEKVMIFSYGGDVITLNHLITDYRQNQHDHLTDFHFSNHIDAVTDGDLKVNQLEIAFALKNMNTSLLESFAHVLMYNANFQRLKLYSLLLDLLAKGMTVDLSQFHFMTEEGPVSIQAQLTLAAADAGNAGLLHLLENLNMQADAEAPQQWLKKNLVSYYETKKSENPSLPIKPKDIAQQCLDHWLTNRVLVTDGAQLSISLHYEDGQLLINGEKPTLSRFLLSDTPVETR